MTDLTLRLHLPTVEEDAPFPLAIARLDLIVDGVSIPVTVPHHAKTWAELVSAENARKFQDRIIETIDTLLRQHYIIDLHLEHRTKP